MKKLLCKKEMLQISIMVMFSMEKSALHFDNVLSEYKWNWINEWSLHGRQDGFRFLLIFPSSLAIVDMPFGFVYSFNVFHCSSIFDVSFK